MEIKKLMLNKKAQVGAKIDKVLILIISVIILFQIFSALVPEAQSAGDEFSDASKCAEAGCFDNATLTPSCVINSSLEGTGACQNDIENVPLSSLFGNSGIVILLLMVSLFIIVLKMVLPSSKK